MIRDAVVAHSSPGRLRIKIASLKGDEGALAACRDQAVQCPGVVAIEVNPVTGSMLFIHQTSVAAIAEYARVKDLFSLEEQKQVQRSGHRKLHENITETFEGFDRKIKSLTDGEMNLGGLAFAVMLGVGTLQLLRGNSHLPPWNVAFWYAFSIFLKSKEPESKEPESKELESKEL